MHSWEPPRGECRLRAGEVHIWGASLDICGPVLEELTGLLSGEERRRAGKLKSARDGDRFIAARGTLRQLLARNLHADPSAIEFSLNPYGKPSLKKDMNPDDIRFNVSYSNELMLIAVSRGMEVGVDIEYMRPDIECVELAKQFFTTGEAASLCSLPREEMLKNFYRVWTCKEAYIKATGLGLSMPLNHFEVTLLPNGSAALKSSDGSMEDISMWSLFELTLADKYKGALTTKKHPNSMRFFQTDLDGLKM
jgi:4'-phosphopantetheinyl transferase